MPIMGQHQALLLAVMAVMVRAARAAELVVAAMVLSEVPGLRALVVEAVEAAIALLVEWELQERILMLLTGLVGEEVVLARVPLRGRMEVFTALAHHLLLAAVMAAPALSTSSS